MKIYGDHLTRIQTVEDIVQIIKSCVVLEKPTTFSIEGDWGRGKTWLIDKIEDSLKGLDISVNNSKVRKGVSDEYLVFKYNAWEKDYYDEPLLAILITMVNQLNQELFEVNFLKSELIAIYEETKEILEEALRTISKRVIGVDVVDFGKKGLQIFKKIKEQARIELKATYCDNIEKDIATVVAALNKLAKCIPIVFIVDELDRCIPAHSIKTLERLHHIFGKVTTAVTVISINEKQLKNTVELMFGENISFESYMRKFLDFRITLNSGYTDIGELHLKLKSYFNLFGSEGDRELQDEIISNVCGSMSAREFEKVYNNAIMCHRLIGKESNRFSKDCVAAEILLFSCKIAIEREKTSANIMPMYVNTPKSNLGLYIKEILKRKNMGTHLDLDKSLDMVLYICTLGLGILNEMQLTYAMEDEVLLEEFTCFYEEYVRFYRLFTI